MGNRRSRLVHDWRTVLKRAWSIRLSLLAAAFTAWASWWGLREYGTPLYITAPTVILNLAVVVARIWSQGYDDAG